MRKVGETRLSGGAFQLQDEVIAEGARQLASTIDAYGRQARKERFEDVVCEQNM